METARRLRLSGHLALALLLWLGGAPFAFAYTVNGRITLGTYDGIERLSQASQGDNSNDVATVSGRFFLRVADVSENKLQFIADVRDKHDFFGLVDAQRLQLTDHNTLQLRELSALYPGKTLFTQAGRFPVSEAGAVYTDGALQGFVLSKTFRWAVFGGLNPKRPEQTYLQGNSDSQVFGSYLTIIPVMKSWGTSLYIDTAGVTNIVQGLTDRTYWYTNAVLQWNSRSRFSILSYLDFVPNVYLQNGTVNWEQALGSKLTSSLTFFSIDVLEYIRLQNVRSQLPSSPYKEGSAKLRFDATSSFSMEAAYSNGHRNFDNLNRQETSLRYDFLRLFGKHWDFSILGGYRDNFVSIDKFGSVHLGYFSDLLELGLDEDYAIESYKNGFGVYHPLTSELSLSRTFHNNLYGTFSYQDVHDERVQISTVFLKVSYRFGNKEIPPARDGAPPKGRL